MKDVQIDYHSLLKPDAPSLAAKAAHLAEQLPYVWKPIYEAGTPHITNLSIIELGTFQFIYDDYATLEQLGKVPYHPTFEARLMGVMGYSNPHERARDDGRLKGWVGPTGKVFGHEWDKGHFIGHSLGGAVNQWEINVFVQRRSLNRGWSKAGRQYRLMEKYCVQNPGTFCFSRPIYEDGSAKPIMLEFGLLKVDGTLWVEQFDN